MHYWGVWHNNEPISWYRSYFPALHERVRLPGVAAARRRSAPTPQPEDWNMTSYIMEHHQTQRTAATD
ncbi:MAG: hypothetical protein MZW92_02770 [Comamonadaceae bacterium]|nr:hypothetical protein [Comamonadaceae bacterium]